MFLPWSPELPNPVIVMSGLGGWRDRRNALTEIAAMNSGRRINTGITFEIYHDRQVRI